MSDTTDMLEREIEAHRANVEETLDKLKNRLSVDRVVDDIGQFIGIEDMPTTLAGAGQKLRENPVALGLIGVGLAWMVLGRGRSEDASEGRRDTEERSYRPVSGAWPATPHAPSEMYGSRAPDDATAHAGRGAGRVREAADDLTDRVGDAAEKLRDRAGRAASQAEDRVAQAAGSAKDMAANVAGRVHSGVEDARRQVRPLSAQLGKYPLLLGAAALIAGAVIGSALPRTRTEDRLMSGPRDRLLDEAKAATRGLKSRAKEAAQDTYEAAVDAAENEGLLPDPVGTLASKLGTVAEAAVDEAKAHVEPVLQGDAGDKPLKAAKSRG